MNHSTKTLFALLAGALMTTAAQAQQTTPGWMVGVAGGMSSYNDSCDGVTSCDTTDSAVRINAGFRTTSGLVLEVVSFNFGKLTGSDGGIRAEVGAKALGAGAAFYAPMSPTTALFGRLGLASVKANARASGFGVTVTDSENHMTLYGGVGFAWSVAPNAAFEVAFDVTNMKYGGETIGVGAATVGVSFRF